MDFDQQPTEPLLANGPPPRLDGRYQPEERIGEGAFAVTWRARDLLLNRPVALKLLRREHATDRAFLTRFEREARAAAAVNHPNVVHVYDFGTQGDQIFLVLQYVQGRDLRHVLDDGRRLSLPVIAEIAGQLLRGLQAIHEAGLVHRDIKPRNILVGNDGIVRVTDFGIARAPSDATLTSDGSTIGTANYMAPEQARGDSVGPASDLYAAGVVLFELLTGRLPFEADHPLAMMLNHVQAESPPPSAVTTRPIPPALDAVVLRALAKSPADRYPSASAMLDALDAAVATPLHAGVPPTPPRTHANDAIGRLTGPAAAPRDRVPISAAPILSATPILRRPARRGAAWLWPLIVATLAVALVGGVAASVLRDDGDERRGQLAAAPPSRTAEATATATATSRALILQPAASTRTPRPRPTATRAPRPAPTETPAPEPTRTPEPTNTVAPLATEPPAAPTDGDGEAPIVLVDETADDVPGETTAEPLPTIRFSAGDWQGGYFRGDAQWYGRAWTAVYGARGSYPEASISFRLSEDPAGSARLTLAGLDDEWDGTNPMRVVVNGTALYDGPAPFASWDGVGEGASAAWTSVAIEVPAGLLHAGENRIVVANGAPSASFGSPPYILLSDAELAFND